VNLRSALNGLFGGTGASATAITAQHRRWLDARRVDRAALMRRRFDVIGTDPAGLFALLRDGNQLYLASATEAWKVASRAEAAELVRRWQEAALYGRRAELGGEQQTTRVVGRVYGQKLRLVFGQRSSTWAPVPDTWLYWGTSRVNIDSGSLPAKLARTIPSGYARAEAWQWKPFVALALAMGWLRAPGRRTAE
jgi:hypothetical protein